MGGMQNFQDVFERRKRSFISAFSIYTALPFKVAHVVNINLFFMD